MSFTPEILQDRLLYRLCVHLIVLYVYMYIIPSRLRRLGKYSNYKFCIHYNCNLCFIHLHNVGTSLIHSKDYHVPYEKNKFNRLYACIFACMCPWCAIVQLKNACIPSKPCISLYINTFLKLYFVNMIILHVCVIKKFDYFCTLLKFAYITAPLG